MIKSLFNKDQLQSLREEFIEFKLNEMTHEEMYKYLRDILIHDANILNEDQLRDEIDEYDENLYEILAPVALDEDGSYEILQEYINEIHENDWINDL